MSVSVVSEADLVCAVERRLRGIARKERELERLQAEMEARIEEVRRRYAAAIAGRVRAIERLGEELRCFCERNRECIVRLSRKSLRTPTGRVGWRMRRASVVLREGYTEQRVCGLLCDAGRSELVRVERRLDRQAVWRVFAAGVLSGSQLRELGLDLSEPREEFYFHTNRLRAGVACRRER